MPRLWRALRSRLREVKLADLLILANLAKALIEIVRSPRGS
jgi:hypothetical protein